MSRNKNVPENVQTFAAFLTRETTKKILTTKGEDS